MVETVDDAPRRVIDEHEIAPASHQLGDQGAGRLPAGHPAEVEDHTPLQAGAVEIGQDEADEVLSQKAAEGGRGGKRRRLLRRQVKTRPLRVGGKDDGQVPAGADLDDDVPG